MRVWIYIFLCYPSETIAATGTTTPACHRRHQVNEYASIRYYYLFKWSCCDHETVSILSNARMCVCACYTHDYAFVRIRGVRRLSTVRRFPQNVALDFLLISGLFFRVCVRAPVIVNVRWPSVIIIIIAAKVTSTSSLHQKTTPDYNHHWLNVCVSVCVYDGSLCCNVLADHSVGIEWCDFAFCMDTSSLCWWW